MRPQRLGLIPFACVCALAAACDTPSATGPDASKDANGVDAPVYVDAAADADGPEAAPACTLTSPPSDATCAACLTSSCCATTNACTGSTECVAYVACARACAPADAGASDAGASLDATGSDGGGEGSGFVCYKNCMKQYPNGINDAIVLMDCEDNACAGKCN